MISNLSEINRILLSVQLLASRRLRVPVRMLVGHLRGEVVRGTNPKFEPIINFVLKLGLASQTRSGICLTDFGRELLSHNRSEMYELEQDQCRLLLRKCYLDGVLRSELKQFFRKFSAESDDKIVWSPIDSEPFGDFDWIADHLLQLGLLKNENNTLVVDPNYRDTVLQFLDESSDFTAEQLEQDLRQKRLVGAIAESYVLEFEKTRLRNEGHRVESACVQRISKIRVNAGYDICSFDGASQSLQHNRFIEVKGSGKSSVRFIWTPNEMKIASDLRGRYWIYFVGGINRRAKTVSREPIMIQDPHVSLRSGVSYRISSPGNVLVEGSISGQPLVPNIKVRRVR